MNTTIENNPKLKIDFDKMTDAQKSERINVKMPRVLVLQLSKDLKKVSEMTMSPTAPPHAIIQGLVWGIASAILEEELHKSLSNPEQQ